MRAWTTQRRNVSGERDRQRSRDLGDRAIPIKDFLDRSTTELWRVLRWTCHDDSLLPRSPDHGMSTASNPGRLKQLGFNVELAPVA